MTATAEQPAAGDGASPESAAWLTRLIVLGLLGLTVAGFLGSFYWGLDLLANGRLLYVLFATPGVLIGLWRRDVVAVGLAVSVIVLNAVMIGPLFWGSAGTATAAEDTLRVVSYNMYHRNRHVDAILALIEGSDADVVFLHELDPMVRRAIEEDVAGYEWAMEDGWGFASGSAALVRTGTEHRATTLRIGPLQRFPTVQLTYAGATVELVGIHPLSPLGPGRARARDQALQDVAAWVAERPGEVVVAGDFNATPFSVAYRNFRAVSGLTSSIDGAGWQATWPDTWWLFKVPIDHLFHSDGLATVERTVGEHAGSDHAALIVDLAPAG